MREQVHGGDIYRNQNVMDFSVNTNPLGPPETVKQVMAEMADKIICYPDMECEVLRNTIGVYENVDSQMILCGNGAAELFYAVVFAIRPKQALLLAPTFSEYEKALNVVDAKVQYYYLRKENGFQVQKDILENITMEQDMMFFCNPNNPTGLVTEPELLQKIIQKCEENKVFLVLDECFIDFLGEENRYEMKAFCQSCKYLLIVKAFTKIFCMPGLRLGYCMSGNIELLLKMRGMMQAWNVSVPAQLSGIVALKEPDEYLKKTKQFVKAERAYLAAELKNLGYQVYDSQANYLFFEGNPGLYEEALQAGFLIRSCKNYVGLEDGFYRIAVRTHEENKRLITWLKQL